MTQDAAATGARLWRLPPARWREVLLWRGVRVLALGDAAAPTPTHLDALACHLHHAGVVDAIFWGRLAAPHRDRCEELIGLHRQADAAARPDGAASARPPPRIAARDRFEPIDILEDADLIADRIRAAAGVALALFDLEAPLDRRLDAALARAFGAADATPVAPPPNRIG